MLKYRIISGSLIVGALILAAQFMPPLGIWILLVGISALAQREFYNMATRAGLPVFRIVGQLCGAALITATFFTIGPSAEQVANAYKWEHLVLMSTLIAVFARQFPQKHNDQPLATIACTLFGVFYVPYLFNFFTRLVFAWPDVGVGGAGDGATGRLLVLYLVVVVKSADIGAYTFGRLVGRHKLFPRISPGKTWEGATGGLALAVAASLLFRNLGGGQVGAIPLRTMDAVILGILLSIVGMVGDMFESLLKRAAGMKDSGSSIPGMGGILDVLDSLLFGAPILYVYSHLVLS